MQRRRIGAVEGDTTAPKRLAIGARDGVCDGVVRDGGQVPAFQALDDRLELGARGGGGEAGVRALRRGAFAVDRRSQRSRDFRRRRELARYGSPSHRDRARGRPGAAPPRAPRSSPAPARRRSAEKFAPAHAIPERFAHAVDALRRASRGRESAQPPRRPRPREVRGSIAARCSCPCRYREPQPSRRARSRRANFWTLPVDVLGISANTIVRGHLDVRQPLSAPVDELFCRHVAARLHLNEGAGRLPHLSSGRATTAAS